jgi:hypothetical protein
MSSVEVKVFRALVVPHPASFTCYDVYVEKGIYVI